MKTGGAYSLKLERLTAERQQSAIRLLFSITTSILLIRYYFDQNITGADRTIPFGQVVSVIALLMCYSITAWALVRWAPSRLRTISVVESIVELAIITYLIQATAATGIPFYLWYIFYVMSVATRFGRQYAILALAGSIVSLMGGVLLAPERYNIPAVLGLGGFLLVLAFMFGQISEKQLTYQASLSIVNEFRAELTGLATSIEILDHLLARTKALLNVEDAWFLPAQRGADGSEAPGLRSAGAEPVLLSAFREGGGAWNVENILVEQRPVLSSSALKDSSLPDNTAAKLGIRNLAAAPMMVRNVPVGVVYAANRRDRPLSGSDVQILDLIATQAAPVVENALLWERLREAAAAEERLRIARDLHDNFLQTLAAIKLHLERCKLLIQRDSEKAVEGIEKIHWIATRGLAEVRSYLSELRMMGPEPSRFRQAVERCTSDAAVKGGFEPHLEIKIPEEAMPPNVALAAFQILRELLNNAAAHSQAHNVCVRVYTENGQLYLEVEDDGKGFDIGRVRAEKASEGHLGLVGVEERARQSNGGLTLSSEPGKGTRAVAVLSI
jgi:signal transduction histidine kinase